MKKPRAPGATRPREVVKDFYSPGEFGRKVGRSPDTVRAWIRAGQLAAEVDGAGAYRIPREVYEAGLNAVGAPTHAPPPRGAVPPGRAVQPEPTPTVWDMVRGLPADATVQVRVTRQEPREWRGQRVAGYVGTLTGTVDVEDLRREYGGGSYRLDVFHADDVIGSATVEVAGDPRTPREGQGQRDDGRERDRDGGEVGRLRREVEDLKRSRGGELVKSAFEFGGPILKEIVGAIAQRRDQGPGPLDVVRLLGEVRGLLAPGPSDPAGLAEVRRAYRAGIEDGMDRGGGAPATSGEQGIMDQIIDVVKQAAPAFAPLAAGWLARQAGLAAPAMNPGAPALAPGAQATEGGTMPNPQAPQAIPPEVAAKVKEMVDLVLEELGRPEAERDFTGLAAFLDAALPDDPPMSVKLAELGPRFAPAILKQLDARLVAPEVLPALTAFIEFLRKREAEEHAAEAAAEAKA